MKNVFAQLFSLFNLPTENRQLREENRQLQEENKKLKFKIFLEEQVITALDDDNRWFASQANGHSVSHQEALDYFTKHGAEAFAKKYRNPLAEQGLVS